MNEYRLSIHKMMLCFQESAPTCSALGVLIIARVSTEEDRQVRTNKNG